MAVCMAVWPSLWPCGRLYGLVAVCMAVWPSVWLYGRVAVCMAVWPSVWPCGRLYGRVYGHLYGRVARYAVLCRGLVCSRLITLSGSRFLESQIAEYIIVRMKQSNHRKWSGSFFKHHIYGESITANKSAIFRLLCCLSARLYGCFVLMRSSQETMIPPLPSVAPQSRCLCG